MLSKRVKKKIQKTQIAVEEMTSTSPPVQEPVVRGLAPREDDDEDETLEPGDVNDGLTELRGVPEWRSKKSAERMDEGRENVKETIRFLKPRRLDRMLPLLAFFGINPGDAGGISLGQLEPSAKLTDVALGGGGR